MPEKQLLVMCDASELAAGYVFLINNYNNEDRKETLKITPTLLDQNSKCFSLEKVSLTMHAIEPPAMHLLLVSFGQILWGMQKLLFFRAEDKALTSFSRRNTFPLMLDSLESDTSN